MGINMRRWKNLVPGLLFLSPNIAGFLVFTLVPLVFSLVLAFTNWDLTQHNMFRDEPIAFVGLRNFRHLLGHPAFYKYLGNTLFFMMAIPFGIVGSLVMALLLSKEMRGGSRSMLAGLIVGALLAGSILLLLVVGGRTDGFGGAAVRGVQCDSADGYAGRYVGLPYAVLPAEFYFGCGGLYSVEETL